MIMEARLAVTSVAVLSPYGHGVSDFVRGVRAGPAEFSVLQDSYGLGPRVAKVPAYDARQLLATRAISHFDRLTQHVCIAADQLHASLGFSDLAQRRALLADERIAMVIGTSGPLQSVLDFDLQTIREPMYVQPSVYPNVVFNVPASYAAIRRSIRGSCITLTNGDTSALDAFGVAAKQLGSGRYDLVLMGGTEEATAAYALYQAARAATRQQECPPLCEGVVLFALERAEQAERRGQLSLAGLLGFANVFCPDPARGLRECLRRLRQSCGTRLNDIGLLCAETRIDAAALGIQARKRIDLFGTLGHTGAMYGATALLAALASDAAEPQEMLLILQNGADGACSAALLQRQACFNSSCEIMPC